MVVQVAWDEWVSAGSSTGVAGLPPAKEEAVSPAPAVGSSPQAEEITKVPHRLALTAAMWVGFWGE